MNPFIPRPSLASLLATGLLLLSSAAQAVQYGTLLPENSTLGFVSRQMGVPVNGRFRRFAAELDFDPARAASARGSFEVELASVDTGSNEADEEVKGKDWLFVKNFPRARFEIAGIRPLGGNRYEIRGPLTLRDMRHDIVIAASLREAAGRAIFEGRYLLKRLDFNIGGGAWGDTDTVANEVEVRFSLAFRAKPEAASRTTLRTAKKR